MENVRAPELDCWARNSVGGQCMPEAPCNPHRAKQEASRVRLMVTVEGATEDAEYIAECLGIAMDYMDTVSWSGLRRSVAVWDSPSRPIREDEQEAAAATLLGLINGGLK